MIDKNRLPCLAFVLCLLTHALAAEDVTELDSTRFEVTVLTSGLTRPMELAIAPDGLVYFIELDGKLKAYDSKTRQVVLVGTLPVTTDQENGLLGIALDPGFDQNHWVFLQYSPPGFPGQYISRFTIEQGQLNLESEKVLLAFEEQRKECCHHAGAMHFGPDGNLYIGTGDNTNPFGDSQGYAPIDERPDRAPWDAQKSSANTNSLSGKILRIRPTIDGKYEIPAGNLFPADGSKGRPEIYVMGCRNPWRISVDTESGFLYWGDVGPDAGEDGERGSKGFDEINQARRAGNFGWPYFVANNRPYRKVDFATGTIGLENNPNQPLNESPNNTGEKQLPPAQPAWIYYPYGRSEEFPELEKGGRTACAGPVYHYSSKLNTATRFPQQYDRTLFIYEWSRNWIKAVSLDADGQIQRITPFMPEHRFVRPTDMQFGPDGSLYVIEYGETWGVNPDARLIRIDYVRGNRPPNVAVSAEGNFGKQPLKVRLTSAGTFDKDRDDQLQFEWRLISTSESNQPARTVSREPNPEITIEDPGIYNIELIVTDSHGASKAASLPALVGNANPSIRLSKPLAGDFFDHDQPIRFEILVNDEEDGSNDDDQIDHHGATPLDSESTTRVSLNAAQNNGPIPRGDQDSASNDEGPIGLRRMKKSDCFNCHSVDQKRVGPPLIEVANKYRTTEGALDASVQRVLKGSTGVWGKIPMIPHSQHSIDEVREMVSWVYSLESQSAIRVFNGFVGEIPVAQTDLKSAQHYKLEATYVDKGSNGIPALNAATTVFLRSRHVEAESASQIHGPKLLNSDSATGKKFAGSIDHDHYLRFDQIVLDRVTKMTFRVSSAGAGGFIEARLDSIEGPVIATAEIEVNGKWEEWYEKSVEIPATSGQHTLFIRFVNPVNRGGLMNLDSIYFHP